MSFSLFSVAVIFLFAVVLAIRVYIGMNQGFRKSLVSLGVVVTSAVFSVALTPLLCMLPAALIYDVADMLLGRYVSGYRMTMETFPSVPLFIERMVSLVMSMLLFLVVFYVIRVVLGLVATAVQKIASKNHAGDSEYRIEKGSYFDRNSKWLGAITGGISAVVITMMLLSPIMGTLDIADRALDAAEQINSKSVYYIGEKNAAAIKKYSKDLPGNVFYQCGGKMIFRGAASTYMYGEKISLLREVEIAQDTAVHAMKLYRALYDPESDLNMRLACMDRICANVERLKIGKGVAADAMRVGASAWQKNYLFYGIAKPEINTVIDPMMDELLGVCAQADIESVKPITVTILKLVRLSIDSDVLFLKEGDYELAMSMLKKGNMLDRIDTILAENPYTSDISIHSIAMSAIADNLLLSGYDEEQFEELTNALAQAVNTVNRRGSGSESDKVSALTSQTKKHLEGYGIKVSTEMAQMVAKELVLKLGDTAEVTAQDIREIIENYAND